MKKNFALTVALTGLVAVANASDFNGSDWNFKYDGHYSIVGAATSALGLTSLVNASLIGQLGLLNGTVKSTSGETLTQTSTSSLKTSHLDFDATCSPLLLPAVKSFLYNVLDANDGMYTGTISGNSFNLSKSPIVGAQVDGLGILDTRVLGLGVVVDLRAALPTNNLHGTVDGFDTGVNLPFGTRANHVTGTSGLMDTIGLQARVTTYVASLSGPRAIVGDYLNVGVIQTTADSWSLSRNASPQAVPEPGTMAALGLGALGFLKRRKRK